MGRYLLTVLIVISLAATAVADLGYMHASNPAWPAHARLHGIWNVTQVFATHSLALGLLWLGDNAVSIVRVRVAALIMIAYPGSFFLAVALAPLFGASVLPDVPPRNMPPQPFGMDGNLFGFLVGLPLIVLAWWLCERSGNRLQARPANPRQGRP